MSNSEQEGRIALLHHYGSIMNGYKISILTLFVAIFTLVQIKQILPKDNLAPLCDGIWSFALGGVIGGIAFCVARFFWLGRAVYFATHMPPLSYVLPPNQIHLLEEEIFRCTQDAAEGKGSKPIARGLRWLVRYGGDIGKLAYLCAIIAPIAGSPIFCLATAWSIYALVCLIIVVLVTYPIIFQISD